MLLFLLVFISDLVSLVQLTNTHTHTHTHTQFIIRQNQNYIVNFHFILLFSNFSYLVFISELVFVREV